MDMTHTLHHDHGSVHAHDRTTHAHNATTTNKHVVSLSHQANFNHKSDDTHHENLLLQSTTTHPLTNAQAHQFSSRPPIVSPPSKWGWVVPTLFCLAGLALAGYGTYRFFVLGDKIYSFVCVFGAIPFMVPLVTYLQHKSLHHSQLTQQAHPMSNRSNNSNRMKSIHMQTLDTQQRDSHQHTHHVNMHP